MTYLGIDIGGTSVKLGVVDEHFEVLEKVKIPTLADRPSDDIIDDIIKAATPLCETYKPVSVGIGSAGRIDPVNGMVLRAGNLPFQNEPLCEKIGSALSLPCAIDNDANCALVAESAAGACADCRDALILTLGTGVGGAIMIDGKLYSGHNYRAGELGHFIIDRHGEPCECGLHGCFEHYGSATALIRLTKAAAHDAPDSKLAALCKNSVDGKIAFDAADNGCETAKKVLTVYGEHVAMGINSLVKIFMPQCVVLAGGIARSGDKLLSLITPHLLPEADVRISTLRGNAGIIGAAITGQRTL